MNKREFWNYIISFIKEQEINFDEDFHDLSSQRLRALFTSFCLIFNINTDASESIACLWDIFNETGLDENLQEKFDNFMLEYLM